MTEEKIEYNQLETGYEFPPSSYELDASVVTTYLRAVEDTSYPYEDNKAVPPMAIAASAMAALSRSISLPPGTIHISQELEFRSEARIGDGLTGYARVNRKWSRGRFHFLDVELNVCNDNQETVLTSKTSFILPQPNDEG